MFASSFSFPSKSAILGLVPYIDGGYSLFSQPSYFAQSNLGEVGFYVGMLPVIAALTLLTRRWRSRFPRGELRCWYGVMIVGAVLAVGAGTPLEHILYHIPFYGSERNAGRNIVDVDLAACALFAWWVDGGKPVGADLRPADLRPVDLGDVDLGDVDLGDVDLRRVDRELGERSRIEWVMALAPAAAVGITAVFFLVRPETLWHWLRAEPPGPRGPVGSGPAIALAAGLAGVAGILAVLRSRSARTVWMRLIAVFVVVDVGLFAIGSGYTTAQQPPEPPDAGSVAALVKANLSPAGRYGVFDPDLFDSASIVGAQEPDVGILDDLPSVSGYGSLVDARYAAETQTQTRELINPAWLGSGKFRSVGLQVLVTVPESFLVAIESPPGQTTKIKVPAEYPGSDPGLPGGNAPPPAPPLLVFAPAPARPEIQAGAPSGWWFGTTLPLRYAVVDLGRPSVGQLVRVGTVSPSGGVTWGAATRIAAGASTEQFDLEGSTGAGVEVQLLKGPALHSVRVAVSTSAGRNYLLAGPLANEVEPGQWTDAGVASNFAVFRADYEPEAAWLQPADSLGSASPDAQSTTGVTAAAQVESSSPNTTTIATRSTGPALLVWSTAWDSGWRAEVVSAGGDEPLEVRRVGLVQGVEVPGGQSLVRFYYEPEDIGLGSAISAVTFGVLLVAGVLYLFIRRRRSSLKDVAR